jgi:hypothetical protein
MHLRLSGGSGLARRAACGCSDGTVVQVLATSYLCYGFVTAFETMDAESLSMVGNSGTALPTLFLAVKR